MPIRASRNPPLFSLIKHLITANSQLTNVQVVVVLVVVVFVVVEIEIKHLEMV